MFPAQQTFSLRLLPIHNLSVDLVDRHLQYEACILYVLFLHDTVFSIAKIFNSKKLKN